MPVLTDTLQKIAILLDCSVENLMDPSESSPHMAGASELLVAWFEIEDAGSREQLLRFARRLVAGRAGVAASHSSHTTQ